MTPIAITFLVLSIVLVWGGLAVSIVLLRRDVEELEEADAATPDTAATTAPARPASRPGSRPHGSRKKRRRR